MYIHVLCVFAEAPEHGMYVYGIYIYIFILTYLCAVDAGVYLWWLFGHSLPHTATIGTPRHLAVQTATIGTPRHLLLQ